MNAEVFPFPPQTGECPYLPGLSYCFENFVHFDGDADAVQHWIEQGFRHFGACFFRPGCADRAGVGHCGRCVPLRVDVAAFVLSKFRRRILRNGAALTPEIGHPQYSLEKYGLYLKHCVRFPGQAPGSPEDFARMFYASPCGSLESVWRLDGRIVAVAFFDLLPRLISSIYCFYDPAVASLSPGTLIALHEIAWARERNIPYYYLGYWIAENKSMDYKSHYYPSQFLDNGRWMALRDAAGNWLAEPRPLRVAPFPAESADGSAAGAD